jgi:predicted nucleotidyltransferase
MPPADEPGSIDAIRAAMAPVFRSHPEVAAAYVFGSVARGTADAESDIDIGLVYREPARSSAHDDLADELTSALARATGRERVDVLDLGAQGPIFCHQVLIEGKLIHETDRARRVDFESDTIVRAIDFRPTYELATQGKATALRRWLRDANPLKDRTSPR